MTTDLFNTRNTRLHRASVRSRRWVTLFGIWCLGGCSLQNFDELTRGGAPGVGGAPSGGVGTTDQGGGGTSNTGVSGGASNEGGASNAGGASTGGAPNTGGIAAGGTSTKPTSTPIGGSDTTGCAFAQTGGQLLVPPSQGFETSMQGWTTTSQRTTALTRKQGDGLNCEGDWYVSLDGAQRSANWDGAALEVSSYLTVGHTYRYSVAVRQTPTGYAVATQSFKLTVSRTCSSTVYDDILPQVPVQTNWVRMTKDFTLALPADCSPSLTSVRLFVATYENAGPYVSFDLDDFRLIDVTPPGTGTGGAPSSGGASSAAGAPSAGGTLGSGGAPSSGGVPSTGGKNSSAADAG
jgi:hypothetical protein